MKILLILLAVLDFMSCIYLWQQIEPFFQDFLQLLFMAFFLTLFISAILLLRNPPQGLILNFWQFGFRMYFAVFSFWFLSGFFGKEKDSILQFYYLAATLEMLRLTVSIILFRHLKKAGHP